MSLLKKTRAFLKTLRVANSGVAAVEFALISPVFIIMVTYGLEAANIAVSRVRVQTLTAGASDNAARVITSIDESDITDLLAGAKKVGENISFATRGRIIVSSVERNAANNGLWIRWQRCDGAKNYVSSIGLEGKGQNDTSLQSVGYGTNVVSPVAGTAIIFVETVYDYKPLFGQFLAGSNTFKDYRSYIVRQRTNNQPTNTKAIIPKSCSTFAA
jgi:Flp pilus assembly protein TadG